MTKPDGAVPPGVPPEVAKYLEEATERLSSLIEEFKLEPSLYEQHSPGQDAWCHSFYSTYKGRRVCIRIVIRKASAKALDVRIVCYLRSYTSLETPEWLTYDSQPVKGLDYLVTTVHRLALELKSMCDLMPFPSRPDAKT